MSALRSLLSICERGFRYVIILLTAARGLLIADWPWGIAFPAIWVYGDVGFNGCKGILPNLDGASVGFIPDEPVADFI